MLFLVCGTAQANGIIDPQMKLLEDEFSDAILQGTQFFPNGSGGGVFGFFNSGSQTITEITFETLIQPNISPTDIAAAFVCNQGNYNPFFLFCRIDYAAVSGRMTIAFWGTNQAPANDHLGILPMPLGCTEETANDTSPIDCTTSGHFAVSLSDSFKLDDPSGGWSADKNPLLFLDGGPKFTVTELQYIYGAIPNNSVPEPGTMGLAGGAAALLIWINKRRTSRPRA
jgi:hypothetical protein